MQSTPVLFLGTHTPRLDDKGRLILPAKLREGLSGGMVVTRGEERCLCIYTTAEFAAMLQNRPSKAATASSDRAYLRVLCAHASNQTPDSQGRITLSPELRQYAGIDRDCVVVGSGTWIEVWNPEAWGPYLAEKEAEFADLQEAPANTALAHG